MSVNYRVGVVPLRRNEFEVIITGDSNDGDYVSTRNFYSNDKFDTKIIEELIRLLNEVSDEEQLETFNSDWLELPSSDYGICHSLVEVEVIYYDDDGCGYSVELIK